METNQSSTKLADEAARTKATEAILAALPELQTNELVQLAMVACTYRRFANYQNWFENGRAIMGQTNGKSESVGM